VERRKEFVCLVCAAVLALIAVGRVTATYAVFNATSDEPAHIATGMEWLQFGRYTYEPQHPPLARVAAALGLYLKGLRIESVPIQPNGRVAIFEQGWDILYAGGEVDRNLAIARAGVLPFLILLCAAVYAWGRRYFSPEAGVCAVALVTCAAPILGHAGVAATDLACAATVTLALYRFLRWLESPSRANAAWWGAASALAVLSKLSAIPFLAACCGVAVLFPRAWSARRMAGAAVAALALAVTLWAGYRFHFPVLRELRAGIREVRFHNQIGHDSYLLGEFRSTGWWYFFPVALAVKTPIGFLALALAGWGAALARARSLPWPRLFTALFPLAILAAAMPSRINVGVRHILPIYPLLALTAAALWQGGRAGKALAAAAILWTAADSVRAHPDYLAHFNEFAGAHPERILCESDLDWGQDLKRLSARLRQIGADHVSIAYFGSAPLDKAGLPPYRVLGKEEPLPGYIAVSLRHLNLEYARNGGYAWLRAHRPVERVGKSIELYYLPELR
jgi:hypothetical protein